MTRIVENCQLEVDETRGIVYVHGPEGNTLVRICKIPRAAFNPEQGGLIDVRDDRWDSSHWKKAIVRATAGPPAPFEAP